MASGDDIDHDIRLVLDMNDFAAMLGRLPSIGGEIFSVAVGGFDVDVFDGRPNVGESPGDALVVSHDDIGQPGQSDSRHVKVAGAKMRFVPEIWHLMAEVHVVREQRLSRDGVCTGDHPVVGTDDAAAPSKV